MRAADQQGFSLVEVMFSLAVLTTGVLGAAAVMAAGMQNLSSSPGDVIVTQKAAQAIEAVFAARDSHKLEWRQIRNVQGAGSDNGIFLDGPQPLHLSGSDGLVNTADDLNDIETIPTAGPDHELNTDDDVEVVLGGYTREIAIRDISGTSGQLRKITVTVVYTNGSLKRTYKLVTYISAYS